MYLKTLYIKIQKGLARVKCNFVVAKQTNKQKKNTVNLYTTHTLSMENKF